MDNNWRNKQQPNKGGSKRWNAETNKEKENAAYEVFTEMLIKKLEKVSADWKKPWFTEGQAPWPKSHYGKYYHGMNALMLTLLCEEKGYKIPVFATSKRWGEYNFTRDENGNRVVKTDEKGEKLPFVHVKAGERGFPVFFTSTTVQNRHTGEYIKWSDYVNMSDEEKENYKTSKGMPKVYMVHNVDQTNLKESRPEIYEKLMKENMPQENEYVGETFSFEPLDTIVSNDFWVCPIKPKVQDQAYYSPREDEIVIPDMKQFISTGNPQAYYGTMIHEMIHSTGHESRLNRFSKEYDPQAYAREELVAELGAAITCHKYGMDKTLKKDSLPYLKGWLNSLHEKPEFIRTVLKDVKLAVSEVFCRIEATRAVYQNKEAKLDGREDDDVSMEMDEEGNAVSEGNEVLPDKKQGEEEGKTEGKKNDQAEQEHQRRGFHR